MNKEGYARIESVLRTGTRALDPDEFEFIANELGALVLDTRKAEVFAAGFIPNSINIGIDGSFAPWVGALVPGVRHPLLIVTEAGREEEVVTRLARVGFDNTLGYLRGGFRSWEEARKESDSVVTISAEVFAQRHKNKNLYVIDVRKSSEFLAEHIEGASNLPLDYLNDHLAEIPKSGSLYVHCAGGYRSMIAASILKSRGWHTIINVAGGLKAIAKTDVPRTNYISSKTLNKS
jgi:rhodanese-related sulfurtransferase